MALQVGAVISCNIAYLTDAGYTRGATALSMILLGKRTIHRAHFFRPLIQPNRNRILQRLQSFTDITNPFLPQVVPFSIVSSAVGGK